jgi:hypothetical protein
VFVVTMITGMRAAEEAATLTSDPSLRLALPTPTPAQAAALQSSLEQLSKLYSVVYGLLVTSVVKWVPVVNLNPSNLNSNNAESPARTQAST